MLIRGIDITIFVKTQTGVDGFNRPIYSEREEIVHDVIVQPTSSTETIEGLNLTGKKAVYTLGIPKDDEHDWNNVRVRFFGKDFKTFGEVTEGIDHLMPLKWNKKVMVEIYAQ